MMRSLMSLVLLGLTYACFAQAVEESTPATQPSVVGTAPSGAQDIQAPQPPSYKLRSEDVLRIQVYLQPQLTGEFPVGQDGYLTVSFLDPIYVEGMTIPELIKQLETLYKTKIRLKSPLVSVSVAQYRALRATVGGAVYRAGAYPIRKGDTLRGLLNLGGGPLKDTADLRRATLQRAGTRELIPIDLYALLNFNDTSQNFEIQDGDELNIPEGKNLVIKVQGKVQSPALYPYREGMTISEALSLARGEVPGRSRLSKILVIRERPGLPGQFTYINVDYVRFIRQRDASQNLVLQPGDLVWVPETNTPDTNYISALANVYFILDRLGGGILSGLIK